MAKKRKLAKESGSSKDLTPESGKRIKEEPAEQESFENEESHKPIEEKPVEQEPLGEEDAHESIEDKPVEQEPLGEEDAHESIKQEALSEDEQKPQILENTETSIVPSLDPTTAGDSSVVKGVDDDEEEENDPVTVQKILDLFSKDQLVELLRDTAMEHADVMEQVHQIADVDPNHRKIFVHGLGWDTTAESLTTFFSQFGEVEDCNAVTDKITGKSKGYAFILFKHRKGAHQALKEPQKKIGSRMTSCQLASAGPVPPLAPPVSEYTQRKIYISNVGVDTDPGKLLQFFSKYGEIEEGPLGLDKVTGKPRGFALFVYKTIEGAKKALEEPHKNFEGHILHCQKAVDGPRHSKQGFQFHHGNVQYPGGVGARGTHFPRKDNSGFMGGMGNHGPAAAGHLMAPSAAGLGFNQAAQPAAAVAPAGLNPVLGQALTALLTNQGAGFGLNNLLGSLGSAGLSGPVGNQVVPGQMVNNSGHGMQGGYGNQVSGVGGSMNSGVMGGYGGSASMQGGYGNAQMGQGGNRRTHQAGGHMGGVGPYTGH